MTKSFWPNSTGWPFSTRMLFTVPDTSASISFISFIASTMHSVWGEDRDAAVMRMRWALDEYVIEGIRSTVPFHRRVLRDETFLSGDLDTGFIERFLSEDGKDPAT